MRFCASDAFTGQVWAHGYAPTDGLILVKGEDALSCAVKGHVEGLDCALANNSLTCPDVTPGGGCHILQAALVEDGVERVEPAYAQPVFLRLQRALETTGTFKYRKMDLVAEGYDPAKTKVPTFVRHPTRGYVKITPSVLRKIEEGAYRL